MRYVEHIGVDGQEREECLAAAASLKGEMVERPYASRVSRDGTRTYALRWSNWKRSLGMWQWLTRSEIV